MVEVDGSVVDDGTDLESLSERLRVVAIGEDDGEDAAAADAAVEAARAQEKSDEELARMLQAEEEALLLQQYSVRNDGGEVFRQRVEPYMNWVLMYEDPVRQEAARKTVPIHELEEKALVSLAKILDFTDHVWTECFSNLYGRWMHLDPCEGVYDNPLPYEKGWNKKLDYVIAISKDGVRDVTKRYTRKLREVLSRRTITSEETISAVLSSITRKYRTGLSTGALSVIENRDKEESEELSKAAYLEVETTLSLPGRLSGSVEWRKARSELGQADSLSCSSCPVRKCVDAHVSNLYDALSALLSHFCDGKVPKERIIEVYFLQMKLPRLTPLVQPSLFLKFSSTLLCQLPCTHRLIGYHLTLSNFFNLYKYR